MKMDQSDSFGDFSKSLSRERSFRFDDILKSKKRLLQKERKKERKYEQEGNEKGAEKMIELQPQLSSCKYNSLVRSKRKLREKVFQKRAIQTKVNLTRAIYTVVQ